MQVLASNSLLFGLSFTKADALLGMPNLEKYSGATLRSEKSTKLMREPILFDLVVFSGILEIKNL